MPDAAPAIFQSREPVWTCLSPAGRIQFPHLVTPDTKFDRIGFWSVRLNLDAPDATPLLNAIRHTVAQALRNAPANATAALPCTQEADGSYTFTVKAKAWPKAEPPQIFDSVGWPVPASSVSHAALARVRFTLIPFSGSRSGVGVTLRLQEVHLVVESR